jgi:hypothetical protein
MGGVPVLHGGALIAMREEVAWLPAQLAAALALPVEAVLAWERSVVPAEQVSRVLQVLHERHTELSGGWGRLDP